MRGARAQVSVGDGVAACAAIRNSRASTTASRWRRSATASSCFKHRYLLSDDVTAARFSAGRPARRDRGHHRGPGIARGTVAQVAVAARPTGEMLHIIEQLERTAAPATRDGVWVSPDGARALLVAQTAAGGSDTDAQSRAIAAIRAAFAAAVRESPASSARTVQLKLSGPGVFAVGARAKIERAAVRLSIASSILVVTLLFAVYRSVAALALGLAARGERGCDRHRRRRARFRRRSWHHAGVRHHLDRRVGGLFDLFFRAVAAHAERRSRARAGNERGGPRSAWAC